MATRLSHRHWQRGAELVDAAVQFELAPPGCIAEGCSGIHVAIDGPEAIPDGALLYGCTVVAAGRSSASCSYPYDCCDQLLACHDAWAAAANGAPVPAQCVEGVVRVQYPPPTAEFVFTIDPPEPRVGDLVHVTVDTVRGGPGLIGRPRYSLRGTRPFLTGDVSSQRPVGSDRVTYELLAAQSGTAELSIGITFETRQGCPGNTFYPSDHLESGIVALTIAGPACPGDCDADGRVVIDELVTGVRMALDDAGLTACPAMDGNRSGAIQVDDLVAAVTANLHGCTG